MTLVRTVTANAAAEDPPTPTLTRPWAISEAEYITDLKPMAETIELHERKFCGGKGTHDNGTQHSNWNPDEPRYVGEPSDEMGEAWWRLIRPFVNLTPAEAAAVDGAQEFHGEYPATTTSQVEHCVETVRQVLQCGANVTPLSIIWDDGVGMLLDDFEREHTCRDYQALLRRAENRCADDVVRMGGLLDRNAGELGSTEARLWE
ncbi:hypothetical protein DL771_005791 [Monosporascus sp. 5C6A]|nr:hypothetical protein DL771_005791 [Monosporascus sp. 5C6A]